MSAGCHYLFSLSDKCRLNFLFADTTGFTCSVCVKCSAAISAPSWHSCFVISRLDYPVTAASMINVDLLEMSS